MRKPIVSVPLILSALLALPGLAFAKDRCEHSQPRNLQLQTTGVKAVVFDIGPHDLTLEGSNGGRGSLQGRACASDAKDLERLTLTQQKVGDKLVVTLRREREGLGMSFGNHYAYLVLSGSVPDNLPVQLKVGSGDAIVTGVASRNVRGAFTAAVGSGDIDASDVGSLHVVSVGSGDTKVMRVSGASKVGSIGSGDFLLDSTQGGLEIGSIGSGDAELRDIGGDVIVGSVGSGDVDADGVRGNLTVRKTGSGSVSHSDVSGRVDTPRKH
jgi:hypothetical protein